MWNVESSAEAAGPAATRAAVTAVPARTRVSLIAAPWARKRDAPCTPCAHLSSQRPTGGGTDRREDDQIVSGTIAALFVPADNRRRRCERNQLTLIGRVDSGFATRHLRPHRVELGLQVGDAGA